MSKILAACLLLAAQTYSIPPAVLIGIYQVEGGQVGQEVGPNDNGSYDLGPMQINTLWIPELADHWGVSQAAAKRWVRDDPCVNTGVAAWILRGHIEETGDLSTAIAHYHSRTRNFGHPYRKKVIASLNRHGLTRTTDGR